MGLFSAAYDAAYGLVISLVEMNLVPDRLVRRGIRFLLQQRLAEAPQGVEAQAAHWMGFVEDLAGRPAIAEHTATANEQHYEVPTDFYLRCLGKHLKYSCCWFDTPSDSLDAAEEKMLALSCARADLRDAQTVLELGCGWGSLSLFMAAAYPRSQIVAVSNSSTQKQYIDAQAKKRGLNNLTIITCDINDFEPPSPGSYDRVVSCEMFEHMKGYDRLMRNIERWLAPGGKLWVHIFVHKDYPYHFVPQSKDDWMSEHFFTGGTMPSDHLLLYFQGKLSLEKHWHVNGMHYALTCRRWLAAMDANRKFVEPILDAAYGRANRTTWWVRWRLFYMSCEELFAFNGGNEWFVSHYRWVKA